jgi:coenzyme F420-reducing hydrogenase delta subunit
MSDSCLAAVRIDQDKCSRCTVCYSLCPFEAIDRQPDSGKVEIDIQKCQVCGICYSACPVTAIEMAYYDYDDILDYVRATKEAAKADTLVLMCRGNSPSDGEVKEILAGREVDCGDYVPLRVPCAGRVPTDFVFKALDGGMRNIISIQCHDRFCRMKQGTAIETRRMILAKAVLQQLGYPDDTLQVVKYARKAVWDNEKCVGCDKCVFVCPYDAIRVEPFSSPTVVQDECAGCAACQLVCPHNAIEVKGYEFERVLASYAGAARELKARSGRPAILVLGCQWSEYSALDDPVRALRDQNAMILEVPCVKGLDPIHVVNALTSGFDGVVGAICSEKDCKLPLGRDTSERQLEVLHIVLTRLGLHDRFEIQELSPRCEGEFAMNLKGFSERIAAMPSNTNDSSKGVALRTG